MSAHLHGSDTAGVENRWSFFNDPGVSEVVLERSGLALNMNDSDDRVGWESVRINIGSHQARVAVADLREALDLLEL